MFFLTPTLLQTNLTFPGPTNYYLSKGFFYSLMAFVVCVTGFDDDQDLFFATGDRFLS